MPKPSPVVVTTICSLCDEPWEAHGDKPTAEDCVRLLKAKLAAASVRPIVIERPYPYPVSPWRPHPYWHQPSWIVSSGNTSQGAANVGGQLTNTVEYRTPAAIEVTCRAA